MDDSRDALAKAFLNEAGWGDAVVVSRGEDASTRRYDVLKRGDETAYFMDAPPALESPHCPPNATEAERRAMGWNAMNRLAACRVDAFVAVADFLDGLGLSAPRILDHDPINGFALLENLDGAIFARGIERGLSERELYLAATEALAHIHNHKVPKELATRDGDWPILTYDKIALHAGADLFIEWYPRYDGSVTFAAAQASDWAEFISGLCASVENLPRVLLMRDYHAENLILLPERDGLARVGILDFQDAIAGPAAWDIAMFLQDARRDISPDVHEACLKRYLELVGRDEAKFREELAFAGVINALRIVGVFARLIHRDGKPRYADFLPREWGHLKHNLQHPALADLKRLLESVAPKQMEVS